MRSAGTARQRAVGTGQALGDPYGNHRQQHHSRCHDGDDGLLLVILNLPASSLESQDLVRGRLLGREEEKNRTRQFFHEIFSSKLLVASFTAHEVYQRLAASGAEGSEELAMVTKLLGEMIDAIAGGFGFAQTEPIPDLEAASRKRLLGFQDL